jgi:hypothetical protein
MPRRWLFGFQLFIPGAPGAGFERIEIRFCGRKVSFFEAGFNALLTSISAAQDVGDSRQLPHSAIESLLARAAVVA